LNRVNRFKRFISSKESTVEAAGKTRNLDIGNSLLSKSTESLESDKAQTKYNEWYIKALNKKLEETKTENSTLIKTNKVLKE